MQTTDTSLHARAARLARHGVAIAALCVTVAAVTATWLAGTPAGAAPGARVSRADSAPDTQKPTPAPGKASKQRPTPAKAKAADSDADDADSDDKPVLKKGGKTVTGKLNLNTATEDQLRMLPGIGAAKAQRIIAYRDKQKFRRVRDLRRVKGIGYATLKKLSPVLTLSGETTLKLE